MDRHTTRRKRGGFAAIWGLPLLILGLGLGGVGAPVMVQSAETTLVSVNAAGTGSGNGASQPVALSANRRFVAFYSEASDLAAHDTNGLGDAFVRDLQTGRTTLVSVNAARRPVARYAANQLSSGRGESLDATGI